MNNFPVFQCPSTLPGFLSSCLFFLRWQVLVIFFIDWQRFLQKYPESSFMCQEACLPCFYPFFLIRTGWYCYFAFWHLVFCYSLILNSGFPLFIKLIENHLAAYYSLFLFIPAFMLHTPAMICCYSFYLFRCSLFQIQWLNGVERNGVKKQCL